LVLCLLSSPAAAQEFGRIEETKSTVAYFYHARPGDATIQVAVWGNVKAPGIYEIPVGTELDRLLTMSGGAPIPARRKGREDETTISIYREEEGERRTVYEARLQTLIANPQAYPDLQDDDVMVVETVTPRQFSYRDVIQILSSVGTLTLLGLRLFGGR
jgi:hypothetical protein